MKKWRGLVSSCDILIISDSTFSLLRKSFPTESFYFLQSLERENNSREVNLAVRVDDDGGCCSSFRPRNAAISFAQYTSQSTGLSIIDENYDVMSWPTDGTGLFFSAHDLRINMWLHL